MSPEPPNLPDEFDWWDVRAVLQDWFFRMFNSQSMVPAGTCAVFAIATMPDGWVLADNTEYEQTKYPLLYEVIRQTYGGGAGTFRVPSASDLPTIPTGTLKWMIKV